ncbi:MAG TPA: hypothetical protein ENJ32_14210, partial [Crenotrichaceae bacterium]|nr:hypothetical protein [Crenotrichaceae bacterium]
MNQKILALMIISIMWMQTTVAAIDAMELAMLKPYQDKPILYWDSVVGEPLSIEDQASQNYSLLDYMSGDQQKIRLHQGMQKRFYLPAYERIRLYNPDRQLKQNDIIAYVSNGSGLLAKASGYLSKDGHSFIISPQSSIPLIVDIQISDSEDKDHKTLDLDVLISRRELLNQLAPYPDLQWLAGQHVWLQSSFLAPQPYWTMLPYQPHYLSLQGPARIQLKHRFQYEQHATALFQDYRISYRLDDQPPRVLDFRTGAESSSQTRVNMQTQTLGRVLQTYLEIPPGQHRLELVADRTVYVQVLKQTENIYLLPWLNQPQLTLQQVRENNQLAQQLLLEMNALAQFMVRDNGRKASALTAQSLFEKAALQHSYYPQALADVRKLGGQYTFYRDLLPAVKQSSEDQFTAYFITKTLRAIRTRQEDPVLSKQHQSAALKRLGYAYFSPVAKKPGVDRYLLPNRLVETRIRLIADKRLC